METKILKVYWIRHAKTDYTYKDEVKRPLVAEGKESASKLVEKFEVIHIDAVYSSPYNRTIDTVTPLARSRNLPVTQKNGFRERNIGTWVDDFFSFAEKQWADFTYKLPGGDSLEEIQAANLAELEPLIRKHEGQSIIIGTHGTALSTVLHHFDPDFGYQQFREIVHRMPLVVWMEFLDEQFKVIGFLIYN
jgi:2,3-bisphosphoglycerate-dependent phosphoglycerate mutase